MKIAIIALGRLGTQLYQKLDPYHDVIGTYSNTPKEEFEAIQFNFQNDIMPKEIQDRDILIFNLPPSAMGEIKYWREFLDNIRVGKIIFISSSSVFGNQGSVNEKTIPIPITESGKFLCECEELLRERHGNLCIIRATGLYDDNSHPGQFLSSRESRSSASQSVNLISISDLSNLIIKSLEDDKVLIHATNINHPSKGEYYSEYCKRRELAPPKFMGNLEEDKIIMTCYSDYQIKRPLP